MLTLLEAVHSFVEGRSLKETEAEETMRAILAGEASAALTAAFLTALRIKGETVEELTGFARAMRRVAEPVPVPDRCRPLLDTCGTGGGGIPTFNISTASALVAAGGGIRVAKHGNRSISSQCGSADVLEALGVRTKLSPEAVAGSIEQLGIGFLFAPTFHGAMRHVQPVRLELKMRTVFNYLGPLTNPAGAEMQVMGTGSLPVAEKLAQTLLRLGLRSGFVVCGSDGLGEVTISGPSTVFRVSGGRVEQQSISPALFGFPEHDLRCVKGGTAEENAAVIGQVLAGKPGPAREIVLMNAALAFLTAENTALSLTPAILQESAASAAESIDSGAAQRKLDQLREYSHLA